MSTSSSTCELQTLALDNTTSNVEVVDEIPNVKVVEQKDFTLENLQLEEISVEVSALENSYSIYLGCFHET